MTPIFVGSPVDIASGDDARKRLQDTNDSRFANADGVMVVDDNRWLQAQQYERETWMHYNLQAREDRNGDHAAQFDHYGALPQQLGDVVELGSGAFTNIRRILDTGRHAHSITLVDPLVNTYLGHPNCWYTDHAEKRVMLVNSTIEDWQPLQQYDTAIMVNVIAHCRDGYAVLGKLHGCLKVGGLVVFHEPPREYDPLEHYDVGHPIAPKAHVLEAFISCFEPVYRNDWYFIGRKKAGFVGSTDGKFAFMPEAAPPTDKPKRQRKAKP